MQLHELIESYPLLSRENWRPSVEINFLTADSRKAGPGGLFVACPGFQNDGHRFLDSVLQQGVSAVVTEKSFSGELPNTVISLKVKDSRDALSFLLNRFHHFPSRGMKLVGVTGTNGKTTLAYLLNSLLGTEAPSAYIGTLGFSSPAGAGPLSNTTPGAEELFALLARQKESKTAFSCLEVSSHALDQKRVAHLGFELAIFTGLSPEHLDYHRDLESYFQAKKRLFTNPPRPKSILINRDSPWGLRLLGEIPGARSYSVSGDADYSAREIRLQSDGSEFIFEAKGRRIPVKTALPLRHNVANLTAILGALDLLGFDPGRFQNEVARLAGVPGRLERIEGNGFQIFVDYAHTPEAFQNVLSGVRALSPKRVLTLFGCGGDRDTTKRPEMTRLAARYSDLLVLTADNPRTEEPVRIIEQMKKGLPEGWDPHGVLEILDRREAIRCLLKAALPGDVVLILGKGHENYQIWGRERIHFDDREEVREFLGKKQATPA